MEADKPGRPAGEGDAGDGPRAPAAAPRGAGRTGLRWLVRLIGPAILVVVLVRSGDLGAVVTAVRRAALLPLLGAVALNAAMFQLKVLRWQALLRARGVVYRTGRAWSSFMASVYVGMLTPGRVGDALRAQYLRHDVGMGYAEGLALVVVDRLCDLYVLVAFVALGFVRFGAILAGKLGWVLGGCVALTLLGPLLFFVPGVAERLFGRLYGKLAPDRSAAGLSRFLVALREQAGPRLVWPVVLSLVAFLVNYVQGWLVASAMGLETVTLYDVMCLMAIASMLGLLPISVSGIGVRELFFALAFPLLGLPAESGVGYGLLVFATMHLAIVAAGFVAWQVAPPPTGVTAASSAPGSTGTT